MKTRAYQNDLGKYRNMKKVDDGYICADGRKLTYDRTEISQSKGFERTFEVYSSNDCSGCDKKIECLYQYNEEKHQDKNKVIKINERWDALKEASHKNIQSEKGIYYIIDKFGRFRQKDFLETSKKMMDLENSITDLMKKFSK